MNDLIEKWKAERERKAFLALDDGTVFHGVAFGAKKDALGEVVFNTGMSGYQEILTDPSYAGQFVVLTTAEVGNYGINGADTESRALFLSGLVIGDLTAPSNWRSEKSLDEYLKENGVPGIYGVDTRALTLHIREHGNRKAYLYAGKCKIENGECRIEDWAIGKANEWPGLDGQDYASKVTCEKRYDFLATKDTKNTKEKDGLCELCDLCGKTEKPHIVCYDFGVKTNILRSLASWAKVTVVPAKTPAEEVLAMNPDGVFLSNGPADPAAVTYAIENIKKLLDSPTPNSPTPNSPTHPLPIMGICLGHQLLSLACGAKTGRLKFGHHGCNHPVKNLATGKVEITSQNHNFAVLPESVPDCLEVTHVNLNDGSIEGVRHKTLPAFSVQYHPESCPGPHDSQYLFGQFKEMVSR
ncbi:MAG: glutamine-hydrolyzing carbamoyl-phosphate synthase small subunit [Kiritimatiellae bacterium]|nr:glutamine-hydrolyzing carbamoyl-phosphate synthase small subunit [Kiritimatiellia bacterium]